MAETVAPTTPSPTTVADNPSEWSPVITTAIFAAAQVIDDLTTPKIPNSAEGDYTTGTQGREGSCRFSAGAKPNGQARGCYTLNNM